MKISLTSVSVGDQETALHFYTEKLGFVKKSDIPLGENRWLTVVSADDENGPELVLEPNAGYPAMRALKEALVNDGIPFTAFEVDDLDKEYRRLVRLGVSFVGEPLDGPGARYAVLDDTCGNLIQIYEIIE